MNYKWILIKNNGDRDGMTCLKCQKEKKKICQPKILYTVENYPSKLNVN